MSKAINIFVALAIALIAVPAALAVDTTNWTSWAKINGHEIDGLTARDAERGETLDLDLAVTADVNAEDLRWRVWVGGYEDVIEAKTSLFDLTAGVTKVKSLSLELPADMESEQYTLHAELINGDVEFEVPLNIEVSKARHLLNVEDVLVSPSKTVSAGESVTVKVRVENMGTHDEDVRVTVGVPALGVSASTWLENLADVEAADNEQFDNIASTGNLVLAIPKDAKSGAYDLVVELSYNDGRETTTAKQTLTVAGSAAEAAAPATVEGVITVDATTKSLAQGEEKAFKLAFANLGSEAQLYTVKAVGTQLWADARVEPALIAVPAGEVVEATVYVKANEDAELGNHVFTLQVKSGTELVKEVALGAKVTEKAQVAAPATGLLQYGSTLKLAFVGLVVLLVIVGLFIAFRKLKEDDDYPLEPKEGQTYY